MYRLIPIRGSNPRPSAREDYKSLNLKGFSDFFICGPSLGPTVELPGHGLLFHLPNLRNSSWSHAAQTLPIGHLTDGQHKALSLNDLRESIYVLEEWTSKPDALIS